MSLNEAATKVTRTIRIPQRATRDYLFTAWDIAYDNTGAESGRTASDLTGSYIYFAVRDSSDVLVIEKNSTLASQIEIESDQTPGSTTRGQGTLKLVGSDTSGLTVGAVYYYDIWVQHGDGRIDTIVDKSRFIVCDGIVEVDVGPPAAVPGNPASQSDQFRSFKWTVVATAATFTVTMPGNGMVDATYCVSPTISFIPSGGVAALIVCPETGRTSTTFPVNASAPLLTGTIIDFIVRDSA